MKVQSNENEVPAEVKNRNIRGMKSDCLGRTGNNTSGRVDGESW